MPRAEYSTAPLFAYGQDQATSDDYYTPAWVFDRMGLRFDLDVAAPPGGVSWLPADRVLTVAEADGRDGDARSMAEAPPDPAEPVVVEWLVAEARRQLAVAG